MVQDNVTDTPLLSIRDLTVTFGSFTAVDGIFGRGRGVFMGERHFVVICLYIFFLF